MYTRAAQFNIFYISLVLSIVLALVLFTHFFLAATIVRGGYEIEDFKQGIRDIEKENARLQLEAASVHALDSILEKSDGLQYSEIKQVSYLKKPSHSPFAAR